MTVLRFKVERAGGKLVVYIPANDAAKAIGRLISGGEAPSALSQIQLDTIAPHFNIEVCVPVYNYRAYIPKEPF